jgi:hypothetical protein
MLAAGCVSPSKKELIALRQSQPLLAVPQVEQEVESPESKLLSGPIDSANSQVLPHLKPFVGQLLLGNGRIQLVVRGATFSERELGWQPLVIAAFRRYQSGWKEIANFGGIEIAGSSDADGLRVVSYDQRVVEGRARLRVVMQRGLADKSAALAAEFELEEKADTVLLQILAPNGADLRAKKRFGAWVPEQPDLSRFTVATFVSDSFAILAAQSPTDDGFGNRVWLKLPSRSALRLSIGQAATGQELATQDCGDKAGACARHLDILVEPATDPEVPTERSIIVQDELGRALWHGVASVGQPLKVRLPISRRWFLRADGTPDAIPAAPATKVLSQRPLRVRVEGGSLLVVQSPHGWQRRTFFSKRDRQWTHNGIDQSAGQAAATHGGEFLMFANEPRRIFDLGPNLTWQECAKIDPSEEIFVVVDCPGTKSQTIGSSLLTPGSAAPKGAQIVATEPNQTGFAATRMAGRQQLYAWPVNEERLFDGRENADMAKSLRWVAQLREQQPEVIVELGCPNRGQTIGEYADILKSTNADLVRIGGCQSIGEGYDFYDRLVALVGNAPRISVEARYANVSEVGALDALHVPQVGVTGLAEWQAAVRAGKYSVGRGVSIEVKKLTKILGTKQSSTKAIAAEIVVKAVNGVVPQRLEGVMPGGGRAGIAVLMQDGAANVVVGRMEFEDKHNFVRFEVFGETPFGKELLGTTPYLKFE